MVEKNEKILCMDGKISAFILSIMSSSSSLLRFKQVQNLCLCCRYKIYACVAVVGDK